MHHQLSQATVSPSTPSSETDTKAQVNEEANWLSSTYAAVLENPKGNPKTQRNRQICKQQLKHTLRRFGLHSTFLKHLELLTETELQQLCL